LTNLPHDHRARKLADVSPALVALSDDHVGAGLGRPHRVFCQRNHVHDAAAAVVCLREHGGEVLVVPRPGRGEDLRLEREDLVDALLRRV
jgi:hypothetical protein